MSWNDAQADTTAGASDKYYATPSEGGVRLWEVSASPGLELFDAPSRDANRVETLRHGAILSNFGCRKVAGEFWCTVRPFRGGARGFVLADGLAPSTGPDGIIATGPDDSDARARKRSFDAKGVIRCAQERGQALGDCTTGIARSDGGDATVVATFPNGFSRRLFFAHGQFVAANSTMSGTGRNIDWQIDGGMHFIRVDDQRYEIPDALVFGE